MLNASTYLTNKLKSANSFFNMPRRYRRRRYAIARPVKTAKYSNETYASAAIETFATANVYYAVPIAQANVLGTRKVKNFTLTICSKAANVADEHQPFFFALVFLPEGTTPSAINFGTTINQQTHAVESVSLYEPNQNVIMQGVVDSTQVYRFKTRLARNLNSGDRVILAFRPLGNWTAAGLLCYTLNYALSF